MFLLKMQHKDVVWQKTWHKWVTSTEEDGKKECNDVTDKEKKWSCVVAEANRLSINMHLKLGKYLF